MATNETKFPTVPAGAAQSVAGPTQGWADASTSTTEEYIDLSAWRGHYVTIEAETVDHYIAFTTAASGTIVTGAAATVGTALVPRTVVAGQSIDVVVPKGAPFLVYRTVSATGLLRAVRS